MRPEPEVVRVARARSEAMDVMMIRGRVKPEHAEEAEAGVRMMFSAVNEARPDRVGYASGRLADGVTFVALAALEEGAANPLPRLPGWAGFQERLQGWLVGPRWRNSSRWSARTSCSKAAR